jgi:two-component system, chemotaxis family, protein-glutamate methylesterase/glutaminase
VRTSDGQITSAETHYQAIVIGGSAGSTVIVEEILSQLSADFRVPIFVVQHLHESDDGGFAKHLARTCQLKVLVPCDKQPIEKGCVYVAPANYHMLLERNKTIALSIDEKVNWSRPSIDVLFESAAHAYGTNLIAVILSGANADGAKGMTTVKEFGGLTIAQLPESAESPVMPQASIELSNPDYIRKPEEIANLLVELGTRSPQRRRSND